MEHLKINDKQQWCLCSLPNETPTAVRSGTYHVNTARLDIPMQRQRRDELFLHPFRAERKAIQPQIPFFKSKY